MADRKLLLDYVSDWLRANGVDPRDVPLGATPAVGGGSLRIRTYVRNEAGNITLTGRLTGRGDEREPVTRVTTVRITVQPPKIIAEWIAGRTSVDDLTLPPRRSRG